MLNNEAVKAIKEALALWRTFISTRQKAYERKMDKRMRKAIDYAEKYINYANDTEIGKDKFLIRCSTKFFKYNQ